MRTAAYVGGSRIEVGEQPVIPPATGEVQIAVAFTGLCGTDVHILHGSMDARVTTPLVFGHEMSGIIAEVGDGVEGWSVGDRVTVMPLDWDGTCPACLAGATSHLPEPQLHRDRLARVTPGALERASRVARPASRGPAAGCRGAGGTDRRRGARRPQVGAPPGRQGRRDRRRPDRRAHRQRRAPVRSRGRRHRARAAAARADRGPGVRDGRPPRDRPGRHGSRSGPPAPGADVVFEVSGAAAAVLGATSLAKVRGTIVVVAIHPTPREIDLQRVFWRELRILGARVYERADFDTAVELLRRRRHPVRACSSPKIVPLTRTREAFDDLESGRAHEDPRRGGRGAPE